VNLLGNANKFAESGEVELSVSLKSREVQQLILQLSVGDTRNWRWRHSLSNRCAARNYARRL